MLTAGADRAAGRSLAGALLARRLAACVCVGAPVESLYHWRGEIETGQEVPLTIKTRASLYAEAATAICALHACGLPGTVAVPIARGDAPYLAWLEAVTRDA